MIAKPSASGNEGSVVVDLECSAECEDITATGTHLAAPNGTATYICENIASVNEVCRLRLPSVVHALTECVLGSSTSTVPHRPKAEWLGRWMDGPVCQRHCFAIPSLHCILALEDVSNCKIFRY